ncbi:hypothetical protein ACXZ7E_25385 [Paenibacillus lautus]
MILTQARSYGRQFIPWTSLGSFAEQITAFYKQPCDTPQKAL